MTGSVKLRFPALYPKQRAAFFGPSRISVTEASTKAGKSVGALSWLCHHAINQSPGSAHLWVSPVYSQAQVMHRRLIRWFVKMDPTHATGWAVNGG